jgi:hypothetical protein
MTMELYEAILEETKDGNFYKMKTSNVEYTKTYPDAEFTLVRRTAPQVKVGFATIIMPTFYVDKYFGSVPSRMEAICYVNTGTFQELHQEFRDWLAEKQE